MQRLHVVPARRWRHFATARGHRPTHDYLLQLHPEERLAAISEMRRVSTLGLSEARHLRGEIYEVRVRARVAHRILFAREGRHGHILLALHAFAKTTQQTPRHHLELAERRLRDWRSRSSS